MDSPAAISTVAEIVEQVAERMLEGSRTRMRKETRPLKLSVSGLAAMLVATCGRGYSQVTTWHEAQRHQCEPEKQQTEQQEAMAAYLDAPHVSPAQIQALETKLTAIEKKLDDLLSPKVEEPTKAKTRVR